MKKKIVEILFKILWKLSDIIDNLTCFLEKIYCDIDRDGNLK